MEEAWFMPLQSDFKNNCEMHVFCFHHAGGAAQFFKPWVDYINKDIGLIGIQLPGRWNRINDMCYLDMDLLIEDLGPVFINFLRNNNIKRFAFVGHSLGAIISFEIIRYLQTHCDFIPEFAIFSSKRSLQIKNLGFKTYNLPDEMFEKTINEFYGGFPDELNNDPEFKKMFMSVTRKDMQLYDTYKYVDDEKIGVPVVICCGDADVVVNRDHLLPWQELCTQVVEIKMMPGSHFYLMNESKTKFVKLINRLFENYTDV